MPYKSATNYLIISCGFIIFIIVLIFANTFARPPKTNLGVQRFSPFSFPEPAQKLSPTEAKEFYKIFNSLTPTASHPEVIENINKERLNAKENRLIVYLSDEIGIPECIVDKEFVVCYLSQSDTRVYQDKSFLLNKWLSSILIRQ